MFVMQQTEMRAEYARRGQAERYMDDMQKRAVFEPEERAGSLTVVPRPMLMKTALRRIAPMAAASISSSVP